MQDTQPPQPEHSLCQQAEPLVLAGLRSRVLLPTDAGYAARIDSYWCNNAKLRPACIFQPLSAAEIAKAVTALARSRQPFAVRAGGHTNWAGSNNITDGVTIDLGLLKSTSYDPATETAHLEPGAKWKDVYAELEKYGRVVAGGREAEVGVGGFLLGGGSTFYTSRYGFACDNVLAYEVVLADGRVITAEPGGDHAGKSLNFILYFRGVHRVYNFCQISFALSKVGATILVLSHASLCEPYRAVLYGVDWPCDPWTSSQPAPML